MDATIGGRAGRSPPASGVGVRFVLALTVAVVAASTIGLMAITRARSEDPPTRLAGSSEEFTAMTGIRLVRVAVTGNGGVVDVRFQAVDAEKAQIVHDAGRPIRVIDEGSGVMASIPFHNHAGGHLTPGITYYELFRNGAGGVHRGGLVTVIIGGVKLEHVPVQ